MSNYYLLQLPVYGTIGDSSVWNRSIIPPAVVELHYEFDFPPESDLFKTFPVFIVSERLAEALIARQYSGFKIAPMKITVSQTFRNLYPQSAAPREFCWLKVHGAPLTDDFGINKDGLLVISKRAFELATQFLLKDFIKYDASAPPQPKQIEDDLFEQARRLVNEFKK